MYNIRVSQKKAPFHEELKKKGLKMAQNKFKKKKTIETDVKKNGVKKTGQFIKTNGKKVYLIAWCRAHSREHAMRVLPNVIHKFHDNIVQPEYQLFQGERIPSCKAGAEKG